jgi:chorismate--pyruvate lyase
LPTADQVDGLWARRSRFDRGTLSVLVAEIFLPSLWHAVHDHPENC